MIDSKACLNNRIILENHEYIDLSTVVHRAGLDVFSDLVAQGCQNIDWVAIVSDRADWFVKIVEHKWRYEQFRFKLVCFVKWLKIKMFAIRITPVYFDNGCSIIQLLFFPCFPGQNISLVYELGHTFCPFSRGWTGHYNLWGTCPLPN